MREFWRRNQAALFHTPLLLVLSLGAYIVLQALDPRIGVEGFGDIFGYLINGVRAALIVAAAFWFKRTAFFDLRSQTELELFESARIGNRDAERILIRDRLEWFAILALFAWLFTR
jgi:hypothetical protein